VLPKAVIRVPPLFGVSPAVAAEATIDAAAVATSSFLIKFFT
jgi:hypothetical protein